MAALPDTQALSSGTAQEVLAFVVAGLMASVAFTVRLYLKDRAQWESTHRDLLTTHAAKLEDLHRTTLDIALKSQRAILALGELDDEQQ